MKRSLITLAIFLLSPLAGFAEDNSFQDVVFLGDARPTRLRLHITVDGKPYSALMEGYFQKLFDFLDRNHDGVLDKQEAERAPNAQTLTQRLSYGGVYFPGQRNAEAKMSEMDNDPEDGTVSIDEFMAYYRRGSVSGLMNMPNQQFQNFGAEAMTQALFDQLDSNKDGKLSKEELANAPQDLMKLDADDDEMIAPTELGANPFGYQVPARGGRINQQSAGFVIVTGEDPSTRLTQRLRLSQQMIAQYDKDKNQKLSREEIGLDKTVFAQLDTNKDGELDSTELLKFVNRPPEMELVIRLGKLGENETAVSLFDADKQPKEMAERIKTTNTGTATVTFGTSQLELRRNEGQLPTSDRNTYFYLQQFKQADTKQRGYLDKSDLEKAQFRYFLLLLPLADRDEDGRLTEKELEEFFDIHFRYALSFVNLSVSESGRGLFELLDQNRDGKLGVREMRTLWGRLEPFDVNKTGEVSRADFPRQFQMVVGQGSPYIVQQQGVQVVRPVGGVPTAPAATTAGPVWFRKMDRNGDGDISPREWLGTPAEFKRIDKDGDGLISVQEAEEADAEAKKQSAAKK